MKFGDIRIKALDGWNIALDRHREIGELSDDYENSLWCEIQNECLDNGKHCSFICSLGDWLDNISDLLYDNRFDNLSADDYQILFRYYTKILLLLSEVMEDFVQFNKQILDLKNKNEASIDLERGILAKNELKDLSQFINSVCKHKTERHNLHVHNHHLIIEFADFGSTEHDNQIRLNNQKWELMSNVTTILMPSLSYFIELIIKMNNKVLKYLTTNQEYKEKMFNIYADEWTIK